MKTKNKPSPHYDAIVSAPFGAVGISVRGVQVAIELLPEKHDQKSAEHKIAAKGCQANRSLFCECAQRF
ncbi:MAG: hypothetical protein V9E92_06280 [Methylotenera sp.]